MKLKIIVIGLCLLLSFSFFVEASASDYLDKDELYSEGEAVIQAITNDNMYSSEFCDAAGSSVNDWLVFGSCRMGIISSFPDYTAAISKVADTMYSKELSTQKATEWHRMTLTLLALGADPMDINGHDLVADGTYNRGKYASLGKQGLNGWCFALISLDASGDIPIKDPYYTRDDIIEAILGCQLGNGAFAMAGMGPDVDLTAIAVQALAPYYNTSNVASAIDKAINWLSSVQWEDGSFDSYGQSNAESTAQVIIALTCLGINPQTDERFVKDKGNALDGLLLFQTEDGSFAHAVNADGKLNPNGLASAQSLCALAALYLYESDGTKLYDFSDNKNQENEKYTGMQNSTESFTQLDDESQLQEESKLNEETRFQKESAEGTGLEAVLDEEKGSIPGSLIYILSGIVVALGVIVFLVMKKNAEE